MQTRQTHLDKVDSNIEIEAKKLRPDWCAYRGCIGSGTPKTHRLEGKHNGPNISDRPMLRFETNVIGSFGMRSGAFSAI